MRKLFFLIITYLIASFSVFAQLPIKPERTLSFPTEEGSNMSVDLSPDGKTIVFDLLGDLYTVPVKGGVATQITRGIAVNGCPAWSPKGDQIAYISDASGDNRLTVINVSTKVSQTFGQRTIGFPIWFASNNWLTTSSSFFRDFPLYHLSGSQVKLPKDLYDFLGSAEYELIYYKQRTDSGKWSVLQYSTNNGDKKKTC